MKRIEFILLNVLFLGIQMLSASSLTDSLLNAYDSELASASQYLKTRQQTIDSLKALPAEPQIILQIGDLYRSYQCDSAIAYYSRLDTPEARLKLVYLLASIGYYSEAFAMANCLKDIPLHLQAEYYSTMEHIYGESAVYGKLSPLKQEGFRLAKVYQDSLIASLSADNIPSIPLLKLRLIQCRNEKRFAEALTLSDSALALTQTYSHDYAILAYERAIIYRDKGDTEHFMEWLVQSAIADVRCGVTDNGSSWMLAQIVFDEGDIDRAYRYIEYSLSNASYFNARLRYMQINPISHIINQVYQQKQAELSRHLFWVASALLLMVMLLIGLIIYTVKQYRRKHILNAELSKANVQLSTFNTRLSESNLAKEQYICRYLEVYGEYIQRLTQMARKAGIKDIDAFRAKEMEEFYRSFDNAFLTIYRSFVTDFNALLRPEEQIYPKQGELLTTELRIFALIRLGIDSSTKIAKLLCYSPNTIYNYRARVKNAALGEREQFEDKVRRLCM